MDAPLSNSAAARPVDIALDEIERRLAQFIARRDEIIENARKVSVVADNDASGRVGDRVSAMKALLGHIEQQAGEIAGPYDQAARAVAGYVERWFADVAQEQQRIWRLVEDFRRSERQKIRDQQEQQRKDMEARLAQNAAATTPPPPPAAPPRKAARARGDYGSLVSDREVKTYEIVDPRALPDLILTSPRVIEAMQAACRDANKLMKEIPGVKIHTDFKAQHRS